jgi:class 3 adenylate cyclase
MDYKKYSYHHLTKFKHMKKKEKSLPGNKPINKLVYNYVNLVAQIRAGLKNVVVVFIDLVDSTQFKNDHCFQPEIWISRMIQFSEITRRYIESSNGRVVKYIGDEVMGVFDRSTQIEDSLNLIQNIAQLQNEISEITTTRTRVKIAVDYGEVFLVNFDGHIELDPLGTSIDRCARIKKYCTEGTILTSEKFVEKCKNKKEWKPVGEDHLKGIGTISIFQYREQTIKLEEEYKITLNDIERVINDSILRITEKFDSGKSKLHYMVVNKSEIWDGFVGEFKSFNDSWSMEMNEPDRFIPVHKARYKDKNCGNYQFVFFVKNTIDNIKPFERFVKFQYLVHINNDVSEVTPNNFAKNLKKYLKHIENNPSDLPKTLNKISVFLNEKESPSQTFFIGFRKDDIPVSLWYLSIDNEKRMPSMILETYNKDFRFQLDKMWHEAKNNDLPMIKGVNIFKEYLRLIK